RRLFPSLTPTPPHPTLSPYTTLFRSAFGGLVDRECHDPHFAPLEAADHFQQLAHAVLQKDGELPQRGEITPPHRLEADSGAFARSEEHTSELQSRVDLVCRLLLENKK